MSKVIVPRHPGVVRNGAVQHFQPQRWQAACMALEGKRVFTAVAEFEEKRTIRANAYYWFLLAWITENDPQFEGWSKELLHYFFGVKFNPVFTGDPDIPVLPAPTRNMSKNEFNERIERVRVFEADHGILTPDPEQYTEV